MILETQKLFIDNKNVELSLMSAAFEMIFIRAIKLGSTHRWLMHVNRRHHNLNSSTKCISGIAQSGNFCLFPPSSRIFKFDDAVCVDLIIHT